MSNDIYMEFILENYRNPKNYGVMDNPTVKKSGANPLCGDDITIYLKIENGKIQDIRFTGKGCAISQASASILTEMVKGKDLEYVKSLGENDLLSALGIELSPARLKCALLSYKVLKDALSGF
ncbi:MAG: SUF system NifU family Fe-S cluster assembly protein [Thermoplasmata archaeon]|jgi:nitrogen fixation NifU-like protein|nr:SUF system NifU family Fe-S cluster assembly protein [Thermoplasmata archaeon]MVT12999.1 SUF system NifU family Fe-S cluster assembly protein [Euryarchaeota archaeon]MVT14961.1 SUF system NifU family Fe-S cluster assembly protein [Euryarchaeota archaeon]MVT35183.1 SUF system NifU family Fe-S cluster assembly protein [Euryarchaeota archaeon]